MNKVYDMLRELTVPQLVQAYNKAIVEELPLLRYQILYTLEQKALRKW